MDFFTKSYLHTSLWSSTDDSGNPLDQKYSIEDISPSSLQQSIDECDVFQEINKRILQELYNKNYSPEQAGHDFWLTRNGHGTGFWDRDLEEHGETLTKSSKTFGNADCYVGDDRQIYIESTYFLKNNKIKI